MRARGRAVRWLAATVLLPAMASAAEMIVHGQVVDVEPVLEDGAGPRGTGCHPPKPASDADLVSLLAWDLRAECPPLATAVSAYRVYYRWDGRTYSQLMRDPPGDTVPLRVRVR